MPRNIQRHPGFFSHQRGWAHMARQFFRLEASGGILLVLASAVALMIANSPLNLHYNHFLHEIVVGGPGLTKPILFWINDGLMAIFFFLVGLEIKREIKEGVLSDPRNAVLPLLAAVGGMVVPALIYWGVNYGSPDYVRGWAIPAATDIAFALGVLALVGSRVPVALKVLLAAIAIIDDIGAIVIIAMFYTEGLSVVALAVAGALLAALVVLNLRGVALKSVYIVLGALLWLAVLKSGIHPTLAGVVTALCIPVRAKDNPAYSPCKHLEHTLHPWVAFLILPVFGFANAGVPFTGMTWESLLHPVTLGIALGLFVGKQIGVFAMIALAVATGLAPRPSGANWVQLYGLALLCGIGFTMSLFIGGLAFESFAMQSSVRLGVLVGSMASAVLAFVLLRFYPSSQTQGA